MAGMATIKMAMTTVAAGAERQKPADRNHEWIATRNDCKRDAQRYLRMQRKPSTRKFLSRLLAEYLRESGMGAQAREGPYRFAPGIAPCGKPVRAWTK
jgi:hypothetical protein